MSNKTLYKYFRGSTECYHQHKEGWYVDDCLQRGYGRRKQCARCAHLVALAKALTVDASLR